MWWVGGGLQIGVWIIAMVKSNAVKQGSRGKALCPPPPFHYRCELVLPERE